MVDDFKKTLGDTDKSQFLKAISVIDKLSPINFFDILDFLREEFMDSAVTSNKTTREFFKLQRVLMDSTYFFP